LFSKIIRSLYLILNIGVILWLLLCKWASVYDPSAHPSVLSLFSFSTFFALTANAAFIFIWLFSKKKFRFLFSLIALVICWSLVKPIVGIHLLGENKTGSTEGDIKIMTWNVHMFDLGEWTKDETSRAKIIKLIRDESPDVVCLQEFYWDEKETANPYTAILQQLGYPYCKLIQLTQMRKRRMTSQAGKKEIINVGNAIFSKFPLNNEMEYELGKKHYKMLSVEVAVDSSHIFDLNVLHLTSVGFGRKELGYIDEVKNKGMAVQDESQSKSLLKKLINACADRAVLANHIDSLKRFMDYPIIICGDFNDVPGSYAYQKIKGDLTDAFEAKGLGLGRTYRNIFPTLRIDYILFDENALQPIGYSRPNVGLSDHFPVIANFAFKAR